MSKLRVFGFLVEGVILFFAVLVAVCIHPVNHLALFCASEYIFGLLIGFYTFI